MTSTLSDHELQIENETLAALESQDRIRWAVERFGSGLVLSTSFGIQSAVMLHQVSRIAPEVPIVFIDTGYHFPETYRFAEKLKERLDLNLHVYQPLVSAARQEALYGKRWEGGKAELEAYGLMNKVEPMNRALRELGGTAWMSGLRRSQASTRAKLNFLDRQSRTWKVHPILDWDNRKIHQYLEAHGLPYHPLWEEGYVSIGDWHSTSKLTAGMTEEETRFGGVKRECGLHETSQQNDWQI